MMPEQELPEHQSHPDARPAFRPPYTSHDALFAAMQPREIIPFGGPRGALALRAQFRGTPLADVFENLPKQAEEEAEEEPAMPVAGVYAAHVHRRVENLLQQRKGRLAISGSRAIDESGEEFAAGLPLLAAANQVRRTTARLVPELDTPSLEDIDVGFTPVLNGKRQLILSEGISGVLPEGWDEHSPNSLVFSEDQYTVFEQQEDSSWQNRGTLAFFGCSEFEKAPDDYFYLLTDDELAKWRSKPSIVAGKDEDGLNIVYETDPAERGDVEARVSTILLDTPYPHKHFDFDDEEWGEEDDYVVEVPADVDVDMDVGRVIFAPFWLMNASVAFSALPWKYPSHPFCKRDTPHSPGYS